MSLKQVSREKTSQGVRWGGQDSKGLQPWTGPRIMPKHICSFQMLFSALFWNKPVPQDEFASGFWCCHCIGHLTKQLLWGLMQRLWGRYIIFKKDEIEGRKTGQITKKKCRDIKSSKGIIIKWFEKRCSEITCREDNIMNMKKATEEGLEKQSHGNQMSFNLSAWSTLLTFSQESVSLDLIGHISLTFQVISLYTFCIQASTLSLQTRLHMLCVDHLVAFPPLFLCD